KKLWLPTKDLMQSTMTAMPDLDSQQFTNVAQSLSSDYSKVYLLWDPGRINIPTGSPMVTVMNAPVSSGSVASVGVPSTPAQTGTAASTNANAGASATGSSTGASAGSTTP